VRFRLGGYGVYPEKMRTSAAALAFPRERPDLPRWGRALLPGEPSGYGREDLTAMRPVIVGPPNILRTCG